MAGFLRGTWIVVCARGHRNTVTGITRNHDCDGENNNPCDQKNVVDGGSAMVLCPDGHGNHVDGITESHLCSSAIAGGGICNKECRR